MAFFNNLPTMLQTAIQLGYLERQFRRGLEAQLGYRVIAERMNFPGGLGQTITQTKTGLLPAVTTPLAARTNRAGTVLNDLEDGLTDAAYPLEQYTIGISPYANTMTLQLASASQAIDSIYLENAYKLGENAARSIDGLCRDALFNGYMGGNTYVTATLGSAGTAVAVNDVRGFFENVSTTTGKVVATSASNPMTVQIGASFYTLNSVVADGTTPSLDYTFTNLTFSGSGSNTSTTPGGYSGVLTLSANVSIANATLGNTVIASTAPKIIRPYDSSTGVMRTNSTKLVTGDVLTLKMVRRAAAAMRSNAINDQLWCFTDDEQMQALYDDVEFRQYTQGQVNDNLFGSGIVARAMGINFVRTNMSVSDTTTVSGQTIHRGIVVSSGALMEADFTSTAYSNGIQDDVSSVSVVDNIAHITRPPLNRLADVVAQTWGAYIGFCCPTDTTCNPTVVPTATNASRKRAIVLESVAQ